MRLLADHCDLYNAALMERREAWRMRKVSVSYGTQSAQLKDIRRADPDGQGRHSFTAQQQTLRRLNTVFAAFFDRVGPRTRPERRESRAIRGSSRTSGSARCCSSPGTARSGSRPAPAGGRTPPSRRSARSRCASTGRSRGTVKALQLKREHRRWYVIVVAETEPVPLPRGRARGRRGPGRGPVPDHQRRRGRRQPAVPGRIGCRSSRTCSAARPAPGPGRATGSGSGAPWPGNGARSATAAATSTTRPRGRWSTSAT